MNHKESKPIVLWKVAVYTPLSGGWSEGTAKSGNAHPEQIERATPP